MIREIERRLQAAGLPAYAWYDALWGSQADGTRRMHELADVLAIERYNLTRLVDRLEQEGLVTRARSADDGRAAYASITEGRTLRKKMWKVYQSTVSELSRSVRRQGAGGDGRRARPCGRRARDAGADAKASAGTHVSRSHSGASPARPSRPASRPSSASSRSATAAIQRAFARARAGPARSAPSAAKRAGTNAPICAATCPA